MYDDRGRARSTTAHPHRRPAYKAEAAAWYRVRFSGVGRAARRPTAWAGPYFSSPLRFLPLSLFFLLVSPSPHPTAAVSGWCPDHSVAYAPASSPIPHSRCRPLPPPPLPPPPPPRPAHLSVAMAGVMFTDTFVLTEVDMVPDGKDSSRRVKDKKFDKGALRCGAVHPHWRVGAGGGGGVGV